jgi:hypothetical protein
MTFKRKQGVLLLLLLLNVCPKLMYTIHKCFYVEIRVVYELFIFVEVCTISYLERSHKNCYT